MFTLPEGVTDETFKVFLSFHASCTQGGIKYVIDDMNISGVALVCGGTNCPPGVSNDLFNRPLNEMAFNAILYGSPLDASYPSPAGFTTDPTGTDGDQNDDHGHLRWTLVTPPTNGTVTVNADGTAVITRNAVTETTLTFTYMLCDDGLDNNFDTPEDNMCSGLAIVTVRWPSGIMPVALKTFNAARNNNYVNVKWQTATETNNIGFEIQRDADKSGFKTVGFVFSKAVEGNSSAQLSYEFNDVNQSKGVSLYRLKQIDIDGQAKYSPIKAVKGDGSSYTVTIYPTPSVTGDVSVSVNGIQEFDMTVMDMNGRIIKEYKRPSTGYVKVTNLQSGIYVVKILDLSTGEASSEKIVVNKR